ncbi:MAG: FkbM family methyltransferase [Cyanobacteria bacterium J06649_4]
MSSIPFFLYRRLGRWITCEFNFFENSKAALQNKYEVASFKDVFCHPFYWQVFQYLQVEPSLIVDCGAHCGHFSVLANICINSKFGESNTQYISIEPNPHLLSILQNSAKQAGFLNRMVAHQGLLGKKEGTDTLWVDPKNYLATGLAKNPKAKPHEVKYLDLDKIVGDRQIDLLKIDIEGGEFSFVDSHLDLLRRTNLIFMELHESSKNKRTQLIDQLGSVGLTMAEEPVKCHGQELVIFKR